MLCDTSAIIVTFNNKNCIDQCINSIPNNIGEVIIVDNNSCDGTPELIQNNGSDINIILIKIKENMGFGKGVNLGVKNSSKENIIILNPDVVVENNSIEELVKPLDTQNVVTVPKVLLSDGSKINTCGNIEHFTGLTFTRGLGRDKNYYSNSDYLYGLSGVCFAMKKDLYNKIGGFDETLFLYMEDAEISWKINSLGYGIFYNPNSICYHDYELKVPAEKIYHLEKGRYIILRKYYDWKIFVLMFPSILVTELLTFGYAYLNGINGMKYKIRGMKDGLREDVDKLNINKKELLKALDWKIPQDQLSYNLPDRLLKMFGNIIFYLNYKLLIFFFKGQIIKNF